MARRPTLEEQLDKLEEFIQTISKDHGVCFFIWPHVKIDPDTFTFHSNIHKNKIIAIGLKRLLEAIQESNSSSLH